MKAFIVSSNWEGGVFKYITKAFTDNGSDVQSTYFQVSNRPFIQSLKLHNIVQVRAHFLKRDKDAFNDMVLKRVTEQNPDFFISFNEEQLYPQTHKIIQKMGIKVVKFIADNPFDPLRFSYLPISLKYCDLILVAENTWIPSIQKVAPYSKIVKIISGGGFDESVFFPFPENHISLDDRERFGCDVAFTGESYGMRGEAGYRSDILDFLGDFNVKIWGDAAWKQRFPYYENLERFYQGGRLPFADLLKLYRIANVNINMPSPQIFTGFQPRTFEIAAAKGFQIVDWREELDEIFSDDELVTFKTTPELIEKVNYFKRNPDARLPYIEKAYKKVTENYTWDIQIKVIMKIIESNV